MTTQTQVRSEGDNVNVSKPIICGETVVGYAVLGCLAAGAIGLFKAIWEDGLRSAACLLVSVIAFGAVACIYSRRH